MPGTTSPREPLALPAVARELRDAARWAARPGPVWIAGLWYPGLDLGLDAVRFVLALVARAGLALPAGIAPESDVVRIPLAPPFRVEVQGPVELLLTALVLVLPLLVVFRLDVGLAHAGSRAASASDRAGRTLRGAWSAGRGQGRSALGMWLTLVLLFLGASAFLLGPFVLVTQALGLAELSYVPLGLLLPLVLFLAAYGLVLQVLNQLALHSLAQNRRGVASALVHAWRLVRADPWAATRAAALDAGLFAALLAAQGLASAAGRPAALQLAVLAAAGFAGVLRARFWGAIYRGVGGLGPADRVPGLQGAPAPVAPRAW